MQLSIRYFPDLLYLVTVPSVVPPVVLGVLPILMFVVPVLLSNCDSRYLSHIVLVPVDLPNHYYDHCCSSLEVGFHFVPIPDSL